MAQTSMELVRDHLAAKLAPNIPFLPESVRETIVKGLIEECWRLVPEAIRQAISSAANSLSPAIAEVALRNADSIIVQIIRRFPGLPEEHHDAIHTLVMTEIKTACQAGQGPVAPAPAEAAE